MIKASIWTGDLRFMMWILQIVERLQELIVFKRLSMCMRYLSGDMLRAIDMRLAASARRFCLRVRGGPCTFSLGALSLSLNTFESIAALASCNMVIVWWLALHPCYCRRVYCASSMLCIMSHVIYLLVDCKLRNAQCNTLPDWLEWSSIFPSPLHITMLSQSLL